MNGVPVKQAGAALAVEHALDVGHGTAIALRGPGVPALVFDAGSRDRRSVYEEALAPLLARMRKDRRLENYRVIDLYDVNRIVITLASADAPDADDKEV